MKNKYIIIICLLVVILILSIAINIFGFILIKDKDELIKSCGYGSIQDIYK